MCGLMMFLGSRFLIRENQTDIARSMGTRIPRSDRHKKLAFDAHEHSTVLVAIDLASLIRVQVPKY